MCKHRPSCRPARRWDNRRARQLCPRRCQGWGGGRPRTARPTSDPKLRWENKTWILTHNSALNLTAGLCVFQQHYQMSPIDFLDRWLQVSCLLLPPLPHILPSPRRTSIFLPWRPVPLPWMPQWWPDQRPKTKIHRLCARYAMTVDPIHRRL